MDRRAHNPWLVLMFMVMVFCTTALLLSAEMPHLVKAFASAVGFGGAALCLVEMTDFYMFGNEERGR